MMATAPRSACMARVVLVVAVVFLAITGSCHAGERRLSSILASVEKPVSRPQVIVLYNSQSTADKDILVLVKRTAKQARWDVVTCDVDRRANRALAEQHELMGTPAIFARAVGEAVERFHLSVDHLETYLNTKSLPANPDDVIAFTTNDEFLQLMESSSPPRPIFARFTLSGSAKAMATQRTFQQAATYFKEDIICVEVVCDATTEAQQFCNSKGIPSVRPALALFTETGVFPFQGQVWSLLHFDQFFVDHQAEFPDVQQASAEVGVDGTATVVNVAAAASPSPEQSVQQCASCVARLDALEAQVAAQAQDIQSMRATLKKLKKLLADL